MSEFVTLAEIRAAKERLARKAGRGQEPEVAARARPKVLSDQAGQARVAS